MWYFFFTASTSTDTSLFFKNMRGLRLSSLWFITELVRKCCSSWWSPWMRAYLMAHYFTDLNLDHLLSWNTLKKSKMNSGCKKFIKA